MVINCPSNFWLGHEETEQITEANGLTGSERQICRQCRGTRYVNGDVQCGTRETIRYESHGFEPDRFDVTINRVAPHRCGHIGHNLFPVESQWAVPTRFLCRSVSPHETSGVRIDNVKINLIGVCIFPFVYARAVAWEDIENAVCATNNLLERVLSRFMREMAISRTVRQRA